jgi:hypothetical protein
VFPFKKRCSRRTTRATGSRQTVREREIVSDGKITEAEVGSKTRIVETRRKFDVPSGSTERSTRLGNSLVKIIGLNFYDGVPVS